MIVLVQNRQTKILLVTFGNYDASASCGEAGHVVKLVIVKVQSVQQKSTCGR